MLGFPDGGVRLGDVKLPEPDHPVGGDVELEVVARGEGDLLGGIDRFEDEFLDESGHAPVANDAQGVGLLVGRPGTTDPCGVETKAAVAFL